MSRTRGSVRIGSVSLLTLVIVLCLAAMAVLSVSTAQAMFAATERQASFTEDTYTNEVAAQQFVADIDGILAETRSGEASDASALLAIEEALPDLVENAAQAGTAVDAFVKNDTVQATFLTQSGRRLEIELTLRNGRTYDITQWKATTRWCEDSEGDALWTPSA